MKSQIKHYLINSELFISYMDAYDYCMENNINPNNIISTYEY